ncbi:MAG: hypothetical protein ACQRW7_09605, partial [Caulobacterales bacterium]|uniref:hypothetical protein n=1 Tax=Glycocaulis sp. TaxID=1969725 RepID=UPI003FA176B9
MPADDTSAANSTRTATTATPAPAILTEPSDHGVPVTRAQASAPAAPARASSGGGWIAFAGAACAALWLGGSGAYLSGFVIDDFSALSPAQLAGIAIFAGAPALLFLLSGLLGRTVARASAQVRSVEASLARLSTPVDTLQGEVRQMADAVSLQVGRINTSMDSALARLA